MAPRHALLLLLDKVTRTNINVGWKHLGIPCTGMYSPWKTDRIRALLGGFLEQPDPADFPDVPESILDPAVLNSKGPVTVESLSEQTALLDIANDGDAAARVLDLSACRDEAGSGSDEGEAEQHDSSTTSTTIVEGLFL